jgi:ribosomal protein L11 methyltransferase
MPPPYWELSIPVSEESGEALTNFAWDLGALGVVEDTVLRAYFPPHASAELLAFRVTEYLAGLRALGHAIDGGPPSVRPVSDQNWAEAWKAHFRPIEVGTGLLVAPSWNVPPGTGRVVIVIDPGRAFGTGHHGSTAGCLTLLERSCQRHPRGHPLRVLDIGTGSGILAIAAAKLGAVSALALDVDPDAVSAAAANAGRNGVAPRVQCLLGDIEHDRLEDLLGWAPPDPAAPAGQREVAFPIVLANLLPLAHARLADRYRRLVEPGGTLIAGGIPSDAGPDVVQRLARSGFRADDATDIGGWASVALTRV